MEMARAMLKFKGMPNNFGVKVVYTVVYLQSRFSTKAVQNMTPLEAWSRHEPSINHLKVFGCVCYMHIPMKNDTSQMSKQKNEFSLATTLNPKVIEYITCKQEKWLFPKKLHLMKMPLGIRRTM